MTGSEQLFVLAAGLVAGILTSTVGVASLVSFPALLAVGLPPVVANASNTVGMTPAGLSGSFGYRRELREHPGAAVAVIVTCAVGAVLGAVLLLALPPERLRGDRAVADPLHLPAGRRAAADLALAPEPPGRGGAGAAHPDVAAHDVLRHPDRRLRRLLRRRVRA